MPRLKSLTRHLILATNRDQKRKRNVEDVQAHIQKLKQYARNPRIRKETLQQHFEQLNAKVANVVNEHDPYLVVSGQLGTAERQFRGRMVELEDHLSKVEQRLLLDDQRKDAQLGVLMHRLDSITDTMAALCKRLKIEPPTPKKLKTEVRRDMYGKFRKGTIHQFDTFRIAPMKNVTVYRKQQNVELRTLQKQLQGVQLQYAVAKRKGHHDPNAMVDIDRLIMRLKERIKFLQE